MGLRGSYVFSIITSIADSMAESGISFTHQGRNLMLQSNELAAEYELNSLISELTIANMVFGNSFPVIDHDNSFIHIIHITPCVSFFQPCRCPRKDMGRCRHSCVSRPPLRRRCQGECQTHGVYTANGIRLSHWDLSYQKAAGTAGHHQPKQ